MAPASGALFAVSRPCAYFSRCLGLEWGVIYSVPWPRAPSSRCPFPGRLLRGASPSAYSSWCLGPRRLLRGTSDLTVSFFFAVPRPQASSARCLALSNLLRGSSFSGVFIAKSWIWWLRFLRGASASGVFIVVPRIWRWPYLRGVSASGVFIAAPQIWRWRLFAAPPPRPRCIAFAVLKPRRTSCSWYPGSRRLLRDASAPGVFYAAPR